MVSLNIPEEQAASVDFLTILKEDPGSRDGWQAFYIAYNRYICSLVRKCVKNPYDQEDIIQNVWERLLRYIGGYKAEMGSFKTWLSSVVKSAVYDHFKKAKVTCELSEENLPDKENVEDSVISKMLVENLHDFLEDYRKANKNLKDIDSRVLCFELKFINDMSIGEIANLMDCNASTVTNWIYRVRNDVVKYFQID